MQGLLTHWCAGTDCNKFHLRKYFLSRRSTLYHIIYVLLDLYHKWIWRLSYLQIGNVFPTLKKLFSVS